MIPLLAIIAPILLFDVINPVLFAIMIFAAGTSRPVANSSALLLGHTLSYFLVGVAASFGIEKIAARLENPQPLDFGIELVIGLACLYAALASRDGGASEPRNPEGALTPGKALMLGAVLNFVGAPFAVPYLAVIDQIVQADIPDAAAWSVLVGYNLLYAAPFAMVPLLIYKMGDRARPLLEKINGWLVRGADLLMPWFLLALGLFLLTDVLTYAITGKPLPV